MAYLREVQITLFGKTGVGKSAVGNTILHMNTFATGSGSSSVTRRCKKRTAMIAGRTVTVIDTPDFVSSTHEEDLFSEIERSVSLSSPGVHVFLYVLKPTTFTKQEEETVLQFKQTYGEEVFRHTIVLFTHGDQLQHVEMDTLIQQNELLMNLVSLCDGRFTVLNNENPADRQQVSYLLDIIDRMVSNNESSFYTLEMLQEAQRRAEEQREMSLAEQLRQEESARIKHQMDLERAKRETEIRVRKEMEKEWENIGAVNKRADMDSTKEVMEISSTEVELPKSDWKLIHVGKSLLLFQKPQLLLIIFFSLACGGMLGEISADRWACVNGCILGALATAGGLITGKTLVLIQRSPFMMTCTIIQRKCPNITYHWKKLFITTCGTVIGSSIGWIGSRETPVIFLAGLAAGIEAYTVTFRTHG